MRRLTQRGTNVWFLAYYSLPRQAPGDDVEMKVAPSGAEKLIVTVRRGGRISQQAVRAWILHWAGGAFVKRTPAASAQSRRRAPSP